MTARTNNNSGKFILGTLLGGLIGGIAALLMAPRSGQKTQQLILDKKEEIQQEVEKQVGQGRIFAEEKLHETRNTVADWISRGRNLLHEKSKELKVEKTSKPEENQQAAVTSS